MFNPIKAPLPCFGLSFNKTDAMCQGCAHVTNCREYMGSRLERIALSAIKFDLVPETIQRQTEEPDEERRNAQAIYCECYRQVFGVAATGSINQFEAKLFRLAQAAQVPMPMFILISMFGHKQAFPEKPFTPRILVDNRALHRVKVYADACKKQFGALNLKLLDVMTDSDLSVYDVKTAMLDSETKAGRWIIDYKLWHQGPPFEPLFADAENSLDPRWLATERYYEPVLMAYSTRIGQQPKDRQTQRHKALEIYQRMKKHKHEAIANFRAREKAMPDAVKTVLSGHGYTPRDFETEDRPISDPLLFWSRLAIAIQHLECLLFVNYQEGIYAVS